MFSSSDNSGGRIRIPLLLGGGVGGGGGGYWSAAAFTALAGLALAVAVFYTSRRVPLNSPWSRKKRKHALNPEHWRSFFTPDGKLCDGGVKFLKKVRSGGVDPTIRSEVWPFLLGVYGLSSSKEERDTVKTQNRKEYEKIRKHCRRIQNPSDESHNGNSGEFIQDIGSQGSEGVVSAMDSLSSDEKIAEIESLDCPSSTLMEGGDASRLAASSTASFIDSESSDSDSDADLSQTLPVLAHQEEYHSNLPSGKISPIKAEVKSALCSNETFSTWQRIIRLDAIRANPEWISYSPSQAAITDGRARSVAEAVGLIDYENLEPSQIFHAARLVAILEAYAVYDPEIGYCQGMSDLLSPIITVLEEDHEAYWCFVGFMRKARHNFRLDEVGIRRQLNIVSKIIQCKDSHLYRHLEKLQAEDCFFVYRMVVVLFRRELSYEQTLCLWEVMWADQAAIRAGIGKSAWSRIRQRAPPTDDLLLYAIAASVLQRRKLIIEKYNSMEEIIRECNSMAGHLDVWKLLNDAHDLVVTLHDKIETSLAKEKDV